MSGFKRAVDEFLTYPNCHKFGLLFSILLTVASVAGVLWLAFWPAVGVVVGVILALCIWLDTEEP